MCGGGGWNFWNGQRIKMFMLVNVVEGGSSFLIEKTFVRWSEMTCTSKLRTFSSRYSLNKLNLSKAIVPIT